MQKVLVLNGSYNEIPLIKELKERGYYVITTGNDPSLIGHSFSDQYIYGDYSDFRSMLKIVQNNHIFRAIPCANDFGAITVAYIAEKMSWSGYDSYANALLLHHKDLFKAYCAEHNIPSVLSASFKDSDELLKYIKKCKYPLMIKANDLTGGKGIKKVVNYSEACKAVASAFKISKDKKILVEPYVGGKQYTIEVFLIDHKVVCNTGCNCYSKVNPYLIQTETYPSDKLEEDIKYIVPIIEKMADDLKLENGVLTVQYKKENEKFYIIEMMRRPLGNQSFCICEKVTGFPWHRAMLDIMLGISGNIYKSITPIAKCYGHHGVFALSNGIYQSYSIPEELKSHVEYIVDLLPSGTKITDHKTQRIASIFYSFESKTEMDKIMQEAYRTVAVKMQE